MRALGLRIFQVNKLKTTCLLSRYQGEFGKCFSCVLKRALSSVSYCLAGLLPARVQRLEAWPSHEHLMWLVNQLNFKDSSDLVTLELKRDSLLYSRQRDTHLFAMWQEPHHPSYDNRSSRLKSWRCFWTVPLSYLPTSLHEFLFTSKIYFKYVFILSEITLV